MVTLSIKVTNVKGRIGKAAETGEKRLRDVKVRGGHEEGCCILGRWNLAAACSLLSSLPPSLPSASALAQEHRPALPSQCPRPAVCWLTLAAWPGVPVCRSAASAKTCLGEADLVPDG